MAHETLYVLIAVETGEYATTSENPALLATYDSPFTRRYRCIIRRWGWSGDLAKRERAYARDLAKLKELLPAQIDADFAEVSGQREARRAAEVAAAGGHNLMLIGPPGAGKTMIARRIGSILPPFTLVEAIETTMIHSVAGLLNGHPLVRVRPFRAPHHTCSWAGLVGGGSSPRPGEVSLAHNGVLFLDELPEFQRGALEALRQPLEDGLVTVVRARYAVEYPARFMLVAAMNPCPCGYRGSRTRTCTCGEREAERYLGRVSGPLLDRFDLFVHVAPVKTRELMDAAPQETSAAISARVAWARRRQQERFRGSRFHCNAQMDSQGLRRHVPLDGSVRALLEEYASFHDLSARALHRICKVARTLADLEASEPVKEEHLLEALALSRARFEYQREARELLTPAPAYEVPAAREEFDGCRHEETVTTPDGHGAYCRACGETLG